MLSALGYIHSVFLRLLLWMLKLPFMALRSFLVSVVALMGEELRRWTGILMAGVMVLVFGWVLLQWFPGSTTSAVVAIMGLMWLAAMFKAGSLTANNRVWKVRQRQMFKQLSGDVSQVGGQIQNLRGEVIQNIAAKTRGTPAERVFRSNRDARQREQERTAEAKEHAEARRQAAAEQAEVDRQAKAERDRRLDELAAAEHNPYE